MALAEEVEVANKTSSQTSETCNAAELLPLSLSKYWNNQTNKDGNLRM